MTAEIGVMSVADRSLVHDLHRSLVRDGSWRGICSSRRCHLRDGVLLTGTCLEHNELTNMTTHEC